MQDTAIFFALLSLIFGGLNEVVFKRYSARERSRGMMICGVGLVWSLLLGLDVHVRGDSILFNTPTWIYGLVAGVSVAIANILLLESLRHMEVSLGSTIYRLNTIAVVIFSIVFLNETMSGFKLAGILCGIVAVLLLYHHQNSTGSYTSLKSGLILVIIGALLRAIYGVVTKAGLSAEADANGLILISAICWIVSGLLYAVLIEHRYSITRSKVSYSLVSGLIIYGIVKTLVIALSMGEASVVVPIANMSFLVVLFVALVMKMEVLSLKKIAAMILAVSAILLLTRA
jgi:drug/metabolite transporter (DMT)-like permease